MRMLCMKNFSIDFLVLTIFNYISAKCDASLLLRLENNVSNKTWHGLNQLGSKDARSECEQSEGSVFK